MIVTFKPASVTASSGAPLRSVQLANQNASSRNNPTYKPRTRKLGSVFPKPASYHARTTRCLSVGQESCDRFCDTPEKDGHGDTCTRTSSSQHGPTAFRQ